MAPHTALDTRTIKPRRNEQGFTLLETVISLGIFMLVMASASNLLVYATKRSSDFTVKQEIFENARVALEVIDSKIKAADGLTLTLDGSGSLDNLTLTIPGISPDQYFEFIKAPGERYHRIEFGGNELASYVADVRITIEDNLMTILLYTDDRLSQDASIIVEPSVFVKKINITGKKAN